MHGAAPAQVGFARRESSPGERRANGAGLGVLSGIARKPVRRAPMVVLNRSEITPALGIVGDCRGVLKPGGSGKRQVTLMERGDWEAATAELGVTLPWWERRCNLLVDGLDLPQRPGARLRIGHDVVLKVTVEDDPCTRMDAVVPGLFAALVPDWRGGACARVLSGGWIGVGDVIEVEQ